VIIDNEYINENAIIKINYKIIESSDVIPSKVYRKAKYKFYIINSHGKSREYIYSGDNNTWINKPVKGILQKSEISKSEFIGEIYDKSSYIIVNIVLLDGHRKETKMYNYINKSVLNTDTMEISRSLQGKKYPDNISINTVLANLKAGKQDSLNSCIYI